MDLDLEKFFDRVNHDILMARVARKVKGQESTETYPGVLKSRGNGKRCLYDLCNIYVESQRAGVRAMESVKGFVEMRLKLIVNLEKSAVERPLLHLGTGTEDKASTQGIELLNTYLNGWGYFG